MFLGNAITLLVSHSQNLPGSLVDQFKKKYAKTIVAICLVYLIIIIGMLYEDLGKLVPAISFYGVTLTGAGFLSIMLWLKQKEKQHLLSCQG